MKNGVVTFVMPCEEYQVLRFTQAQVSFEHLHRLQTTTRCKSLCLERKGELYLVFSTNIILIFLSKFYKNDRRTEVSSPENSG